MILFVVLFFWFFVAVNLVVLSFYDASASGFTKVFMLVWMHRCFQGSWSQLVALKR